MQKFKFRKKEKIYLLIALLVLLVLFISSSMTYHQQQMRPGFIHRHLRFIEQIVGNWNIYYGGEWHNAQGSGGVAGMTEFVVRKLAHFGSYFLLGLFGYLGLKRIFKLPWIAPILTWLSVLGLAALDEYHQYLTGDRTPSVFDVMLDGTGAIVAILFCIIINWLLKKFRKNQV
ncbi:MULTISPECIES: VanZ family protein [Lactobacillus]|uniref:VanZ family protein n=1 Tax=Lactobacillus xujianguonis TaxID=2495899 RepID=A0A437SW74_9LACO|nr:MULTISPECIES: VanZ family protein [Lactobacillus]RVU71185.1 VanZ family protein [Lactobacillus xujianguonis]RVU74134.1 VanZ family protein [Lactobacillus xujianguonis]